MKNNKMYFNITDLLSYNAEVYFSVGERGTGKTFSTKKHCLMNFLKTGKRFIWLRRTDEMQKLVSPTFMNDIIAEKAFDNVEKFYVRGRVLWYKQNEKSDEVMAGYFISLNSPKNAKGLSIVNVGTIVFDEFLEEDGKYLQKEMDKFNSIISTTARLNSPKIIFLSNALSSNNIYFRYFNVNIPSDTQNGKFRYEVNTPKGEKITVAVQFGTASETFNNAVKQSIAGKIASLGDYYESSVENKFYLDDKTCIVGSQERRKSSFKYNIFVEDAKIGLFVNSKQNYVLIGTPNDTGYTYVYQNAKEASKNEKNILVNSNSSIIKNIFRNFTAGLVCFESLYYKEKFLVLMNNLK